MARKCSYSKRDLQVACSKNKKKIESDILSKKLTKSAINKTYVYSEVGKRLKLRDTTTFHKKTYEHYEYLNKWYEGVAKHVEDISINNENETPVNEINITNIDTNTTLSDYDEGKIEELHVKLREKDLLIKHLNDVISELRMENESLRLQRIHRLHKLDTTKNSDILDESLNASDIKHLYKLITQLYNATFNE